MSNLVDVNLRKFDDNIDILNRTIDRLITYGWTKGSYLEGDGASCILGAMDEWTHGGSDPNSDSPKVHPDENYSVKIALARKIRSKYHFIYDDFRVIVEKGPLPVSVLLNHPGWAEATIIQFNDHSSVEFDDILKLLLEVVSDLRDE